MSKRTRWKRDAEKRPDESPSVIEGFHNRYSARSFLITLVLLIVIYPFIERLQYGTLIISALVTLVLLSALPAIGGRRSTLVWGIVLIAPALIGKWLNYWDPDLMPAEIYLGSVILFCGFVVLHLFGFILRAPRVTTEILCAAIANYLMMALLWSFAYQLVAERFPKAFISNVGSDPGQMLTGFEGLYFSFVTLCTVGYGDIIPVSSLSRMLVMVQSVTGLFYVTIVVSRLVAMYSTEGIKSG
jgi:hypothetical protein